MKKKQPPSESPPQTPYVPADPALAIEITVEDGRVGADCTPKNIGYWGLHAGVVVKIFDYKKKWSKDGCEPDDQTGELCKQVTYRSSQKQNKEIDENLFRIYVREGDVFRVIMPTGGLVIVKTVRDGKAKVQRWVHKEKT